jgi:drug/metabolite transporter (DMT)-like permease
LGEPVIATILAYFLFSQAPNWGNYLGGGLILLATFISILEERHLAAKSVAPAD